MTQNSGPRASTYVAEDNVVRLRLCLLRARHFTTERAYALRLATTVAVTAISTSEIEFDAAVPQMSAHVRFDTGQLYCNVSLVAGAYESSKRTLELTLIACA